MANDPILALLLKTANDPTQREAIITAHSTLQAGGAKTLPGALSILVSRLIEIVAELALAISPREGHQQELEALNKRILALSREDFPKILEAKEDIIQCNLNTRRLRMAYVTLWILLAGLVGTGVGGYGVYYFTALTAEESEFLRVGKEMDRHHAGLTLADSQANTFGIVVGGTQPVLEAKFITENGQNVAVEIRWQAKESTTK